MSDINVPLRQFHAPLASISELQFGSFTDEEVKKLSVKHLINPLSIDLLGQPIRGGLYDPVLGPLNIRDYCETCGLIWRHCPGHFGHIELPVPVFHPILFPILVKLLKVTCLFCCRLVVDPAYATLFQRQFRLYDRSDVEGAQMLEIEYQKWTLPEYSLSRNDVAAKLSDIYRQRITEVLPKAGTCLKTLLDLKQQLVKIFGRNMSSKNRQCPHCNAPVLALRQEFNAKLYTVSAMTKKALETYLNDQKFDAIRKRMEKDTRAQEGDDILEPDVNIEEEVTAKQKETKLEEKYITPTECQRIMNKLWENDQEVLSVYFRSLDVLSERSKDPMSFFFLHNMCVPPNKFRPASYMKGVAYEHFQTSNLAAVLKDVVLLRQFLQTQLERRNTKADALATGGADALINTFTETDTKTIQLQWVTLQQHVNIVLDASLDKLNKTKNSVGVRQLLEKKSGLFRKNMMGKRVDFAARSVISPDFNIDVDQVGIPVVFAQKLTFPVAVTPNNVEELRQLVRRGPKKYPGAVRVTLEHGVEKVLDGNKADTRAMMANSLLTPSRVSGQPDNWPKIVHRHLIDGDMLLVNRQPTLHRPSLMAHKARVIPNEKVIRLHYSVCKSYNADFDGDEMNCHFPQSEMARAEAMEIVAVKHNYLVPKDGTPLGGLIQDHVVAGCTMTLRDKLFTRADYQHFVYQAFGGNCPRKLELVPPCIMKPRCLWSGKQVVSTVICSILPRDSARVIVTSKSKVAASCWAEKWPELGEGRVVIRHGELLQGVLDKAQFGASDMGLIHCCFELYGGDVACRLLSAFARLFNSYQQLCPFSFSIADLACVAKADRQRKKICKPLADRGRAASCAVFQVDGTNECADEEIRSKLRTAHLGKDLKEWDAKNKQITEEVTNNVTKACLPNNVQRRFPDNGMMMMIQSGAKGGMVNLMQMSCIIGQLELAGSRPPMMLTGRSLPCWRPYNTHPEAGAFLAARYMTGFRPQDMFYLCQAARDGLVDTAVKTSRSGYLQRCVIKHLEGLSVNYDHTVRESDGSLVQFLYGEDGIDVCQGRVLNGKHFDFLHTNQSAVIDPQQFETLTSRLDSRRATRLERRVRKVPPQPRGTPRTSAFLKWTATAEVDLSLDTGKLGKHNSRTAESVCLSKRWLELPANERRRLVEEAARRPLPVISVLSPSAEFGAVSEKFADSLYEFRSRTKHDGTFDSIMRLKYMKSLSPPGESVGLLTAQSIGEPSTQMTLNTFHSAGRAEANVTLGIPRLRELLMTASKFIKTPTIETAIRNSEFAHREAKRLEKLFKRVYLNQVLHRLVAKESLELDNEQQMCRSYSFAIHLLPYKLYKKEIAMQPKTVIAVLEDKFFKQFSVIVKKQLKDADSTAKLRSTQLKTTEVAPEARFTGDGDDAEAETEEVGEEDDTDGVKLRLQQTSEENDYGGEEEERDQLGVSDASDAEEEEEYVIPADNSNESLEDDKDDSKVENIEPTCQNRVNEVLKINSQLFIEYDYDTVKSRWCRLRVQLDASLPAIDLATVFEGLCRKFVLHQIPGMTRAILDTEKWRMVVEGSNLQYMYRHPLVFDLNTITTNDIHQMAATFGIEVARQLIVKEVRNVFAAYGIDVDYRHLCLLADYMTVEGSYKALNRIAIESNASAFQKMSFETTMHFLKQAVIQSETETMQSPSASLVCGSLVRQGTGCFGLVMDGAARKTHTVF